MHVRKYDAATTNDFVERPIDETKIDIELTDAVKSSNVIDFSKLIFRNIGFDQFKATFKATEEQYQTAFLLWGNEKWKELYEYFVRHHLNDEWPPYYGFMESKKVTLKRGTVLDRYDLNGVDELDGKHHGKFASPKMPDGTTYPFNNRALMGNENDYAEFYECVVLDDISVEIGPATPWFNQPGKGVQVMFPKDIEKLIKERKIEIKNLKKLK